jgi:hypothetical protein
VAGSADDCKHVQVLPIEGLPRRWWFPSLPGLRECAQYRTYCPHPLDEQPSVPEATEDLRWLEESEYPVLGDGLVAADHHQVSSPLTLENVERLAGQLPLPQALRVFAARKDLQRRISSVTDCYLDVGDRLVTTNVEGAYLLHILSDSQWVLHWLLYLDDDGNEAVLVAGDPIGYGPLDDVNEWPSVTVDLSESIRSDAEPDDIAGVEVAADSFVEFLYRMWIENELWRATVRKETLAPDLVRYAAELGRRTGVG